MFVNLLSILKSARQSDIIVSVNMDTGVISAKKLGTLKSMETNDMRDIIEFIKKNI